MFKTHGHTVGRTKSPIYRCWPDMRRRCTNPNDPEFENYGGRGIKVCDRWQKFENFLEDVPPRPPGAHFDRINNDGNYEPDNVRWITHKEQMTNTRQSRRWFVNGKWYAGAPDAAKEYGVSTATIRRWCFREWHGCRTERVYGNESPRLLPRPPRGPTKAVIFSRAALSPTKPLDDNTGER
jgi:hypothetical protein